MPCSQANRRRQPMPPASPCSCSPSVPCTATTARCRCRCGPAWAPMQAPQGSPAPGRTSCCRHGRRGRARAPAASTPRSCANACGAWPATRQARLRAGAAWPWPGAPHVGDTAFRNRRPVVRNPPGTMANMTPPVTPTSLPDVANDAVALARPLDWVGMDNIALPIRIPGPGGSVVQVAARVDVAVDLRDADARGIHMSRLYLRLQEAFASEAITPGGLRKVLAAFVESQKGLSGAARVV